MNETKKKVPRFRLETIQALLVQNFAGVNG